MPSIITSIKRFSLSRPSLRTNSSSTDSSTEDSNSTTTTIATTFTTGSLTPPSLMPYSDPALNLMIKEAPPSLFARPSTQQHASNMKRHSMYGMSTMGRVNSNSNAKPVPRPSPFSPRILNVPDGYWVHQKVLLLQGNVGDPDQNPVDGIVKVVRTDDALPPTQWIVKASNFNATIFLLPGPNNLRLEFSFAKHANNPLHMTSKHVSNFKITMIPPTNTPPLQLAILLAKDSPEMSDSAPSRADNGGNDLDAAICKYRMAAYLWQAYTAEQMAKAKLGRRAFRLEEEWVPGSANSRDREHGTMRSEARVHLVRTDKTVAELRAMTRDDGGIVAPEESELFHTTVDAVRKHFRPRPGQKHYVSVMILDSHWDHESKRVLGHVAAGGAVGDLHLAVFGSHYLHSYPSMFEEVVANFTDCTPTDTRYLDNDSGAAGSLWEAANAGIGGHLQQVGKLFGCRDRESGIMAGDFLGISRSFVPREAYATRTRSKGGLVTRGNECNWHRLDCLLFRTHPCFRTTHPLEPSIRTDDSIQVWPTEVGVVTLTSSTGISHLEISGEGDATTTTTTTTTTTSAYVEYGLDQANNIHRQVMVSEQELRAKLPDAKAKDKLRVVVRSLGGGEVTIEDFKKLASKDSFVKLAGGSGGAVAFPSQAVGRAKTDAEEPSETLVFTSAVSHERILSSVRFYHVPGQSIRGVEFVYDNNSTQLLGKQGEEDVVDSFDLDIRRGEYISSIFVRASHGLKAIQIHTSTARKSPLFGNPTQGSPHRFIPPRTYTICGIAASIGAATMTIDTFSVLIKR